MVRVRNVFLWLTSMRQPRNGLLQAIPENQEYPHQQRNYLLKRHIEGRSEQENVFLNRYKEPITRFGIYELVKKHAKVIEPQCPSIKNKRLSPHTLRHTTASHLLQAGVDINTIRAWLGHVSINTTNIYAEVNLEMKAQALNSCAIKQEKIGKQKPKKSSRWSDDKDLMSFLDSI